MSHQFYARFINFVTNQIRQAKINSFARKFRQFKRDCKNTWKQINSLLIGRTESAKEIILIKLVKITLHMKQSMILQMHSIHTL